MLHRGSPLIGFLFVFLAGCSMRVLRHDPNLAVTEANRVLRVLYFQEDYVGAFKLFSKEFQRQHRPESLEDVVEELKMRFGLFESSASRILFANARKWINNAILRRIARERHILPPYFVGR